MTSNKQHDPRLKKNTLQNGKHIFLSFSMIGLGGCKFLNFFKNNKKQIKRQVERIKAGVNNDNWTLISSFIF